MNAEQKAKAVEQAEKLLVETHDTVAKICRAIAIDLKTEGLYVYSVAIKDAFKAKHGVGMAKYREQKVGLKNSDLVKQNNEQHKAPVVALAKRLLENTSFNVGEVSLLCGLRSGALSGIFKRFGLPSPKHYREANQKPTNIYTQQKATRKRIHINGGMRLKLDVRGNVTAWLPMAEHVDDHAVLSVSITGLAFTLSRINVDRIESRPVKLRDALIVTTGFVKPLNDTHSESETQVVHITNDFTTRVKATYDAVAKVLALQFTGTRASNIEFTALITTTDM